MSGGRKPAGSKRRAVSRDYASTLLRLPPEVLDRMHAAADLDGLSLREWVESRLWPAFWDGLTDHAQRRIRWRAGKRQRDRAEGV